MRGRLRGGLLPPSTAVYPVDEVYRLPPSITVYLVDSRRDSPLGVAAWWLSSGRGRGRMSSVVTLSAVAARFLVTCAVHVSSRE